MTIFGKLRDGPAFADKLKPLNTVHRPIFGVMRKTTKRTLIIPRLTDFCLYHHYLPIGFSTSKTVVTGELFTIDDIDIYQFGTLTSKMHMAWACEVCEWFESDSPYTELAYESFPWPMDATEAQKAAVEAKAQAVLDARALFPDASLADMYDPNTMPPALTRTHAELDRAVEKCYRKEPFKSDRERVELLFALYEKLANPLTADERPKRRRKTEE